MAEGALEAGNRWTYIAKATNEDARTKSLASSPAIAARIRCGEMSSSGRHQSGLVHTVPFGQLQAITNASRDWATVKFNIRLERGITIFSI